MGQGAVDESLAQFSVSGNNDTGTGSYTGSTSSAALLVVSSSGVVTQASVTSLDSNGFTYNAAAASGSQVFGYVALGRELQSYVDGFTVSSGATSFSLTGIPFYPEGSVAYRFPDNAGTSGINMGYGYSDNTISQSGVSTYGLESGADNKRRNSSTTYSFMRTSTVGDVILANVTSFGPGAISGSVAVSTANTNMKYIALGGRQSTTTRTQTGVASIQRTVTQDITGRSRISKDVPQTITGRSRISVSQSRSITGVSNIRAPILRDITGLAYIQGTSTYQRTISGLSLISASYPEPDTNNEGFYAYGSIPEGQFAGVTPGEEGHYKYDNEDTGEYVGTSIDDEGIYKVE